MSKPVQWIVCAIGKDNRIVLEKNLKHLPLREESIIAKSIEFFNNPEPCMIHRSAVINRICMELMEYFENVSKSNHQLSWDEIPVSFRQLFDFKEKVEKLVIKRLP